MKKYDFMRLIVFFDLPVTNKKERKIYATFRKYLLGKGFFMMQYSIYCKILFNRDQAEHVKNSIKKNCPESGNVRIMMITEKQYAKIEVIVGGISNQEKVITNEAFLNL